MNHSVLATPVWKETDVFLPHATTLTGMRLEEIGSGNLAQVSLPGFPHLAFAAFRAISRRFAADNAFALAGPPTLPPIRAMSASRSGVRFRARARPPLGPPSFPRATAWGFFLRGMAKPYCTVQDQRSLDLNG